MNLNMKAAATIASIAALLAFLATRPSFASSTEWDDSNSGASSVDSRPVPVTPIAATVQTNPASVTLDPVPVSADPAPEATTSAPADPQAASVAVDSVPTAPSVVSHPSPNSDAIGAGDAERDLLAQSPFVHSEPRAVAPFPLVLNQAVQHYVKVMLDQPAGLKLAFERSRPFMSEMIKLMKQQGIPEDLVYLTFAESDFSKRGKGPWQFTAGTAGRFGLRVNRWLDERRDPILSTKAAAEYLAELHDQADNDWRVALIGWNTGEGNLERYWLLQGANYNKFADRLPRRTRQLLNRFMAVAFIAHNSAAYGIGEVKYSEAPTWTTHTFKGGTLLSSIAAKFETTVAKLRGLNPALRADRVPPSERNFAIRIPTDEDASY